MSDIFISYSSEDRDRVLPLVNALEKTGWKVFWDRTIPAGKTWRQVIEDQIRRCRTVVVVWTANSIHDEEVLAEAEEGRSRGILVPVMLEAFQPPVGFRMVQTLDLVSWNGDSLSPVFSRMIGDITAIRRQEERERLREDERQRSEEEARRKEDNQRRTEEERKRAGKFFFSYARADSEFVLKLAADLRSNGTNVWLDQLDIPGGARWDRAVEEALHASQCLLVVLSPASVASNNVMDEVSFGLETDKRIVPILFKDCAVPFRLKRLHYIDFRAGYDDGFKRLIQTLKPVNQLSTGQREKSDRRNFHLSWKLSFRGFSAFLSVTLVGILVIYLVMSQSPTNNIQNNIPMDNTSGGGRQLVYNLIQTGSEKAWFTCMQFKQLKLKERGSATAKQIGDTNLEQQIKKQIRDHRKNIDDALSEYSGFLIQLADAKKEIVAREFDEYTRSLVKKDSFEQIQLIRLMKLHYDRYLEGKRTVNASMMEQDCEETFGKGT